MKLKLIIGLWLATRVMLLAQDPVAQQYAATITPEELKENLSILASDALEGRETGKRGQKMAAAFIKAHFEALGLKGLVGGDYIQPLNLYASNSAQSHVRVGQTVYHNYKDIAYYGMADTGEEITLPIVFAGNGRKVDFQDLDVKEKAVLIWLPAEQSFRSALANAKEMKAKMVFFCLEKPEEFTTLSNQIKDDMSESLSLTKSSPTSGMFFLSHHVVEKIFNTSIAKLLKLMNDDPAKHPLKRLKPGNIAYKTTVESLVIKTENVLGYLEGTDKKDEVIVITAHYDHIGKFAAASGDSINNGADDDGSGTVTVMQIAKAFARAKQDGKGPRRSILFLLVTAEEKGLLGSEYYTMQPVIPLARTVVNLNIDMIGRRDEQHAESAPYVYVIGSDKLSTELHKVNEAANATYTNLIFDYAYNDQNHPDQLYYRSDHWNFAKNNIPIIFYFDGIHEDYHLPSDEVEKIEFDLLTKRAQCIFHTAWEIANREQRIRPDVKTK